MPPPRPNQIRLLHYCDVYEVTANEKAEICGGASRFVNMMNSFKKGGARYIDLDPHVIFGGDGFFPSMLSTSTLGAHMLPIFDAIGNDVACVGNHDADAGMEVLQKHISKSKYPWLIANFKSKSTGLPLPNNAKEYVILDYPLEVDKDFKIGYVGIVEQEWIDTLGCVDPESCVFEDQLKCLERVVPKMRQEGASIVVAVTHQREPRDQRVCEEAGHLIDLICGGHDHGYSVSEPFGPHKVRYVKSGSDFKSFTVIDLLVEKNTNSELNKKYVVSHFDYMKIEITKSLPTNDNCDEIIHGFNAKLEERMAKIIGFSAVDLDCRFEVIRTRESNVSNWIADCLRRAIVLPGAKKDVDVALVNAGSLRADRIIPASRPGQGGFTVKDLMTILPMLDTLVVLQITGKQLLATLENGVSQYPAMEGRFPCLSGIKFKFDGTKPAGERVLKESVFVGGKPLDLEKKDYSLVTKSYCVGHDGYNDLEDCPVLVDEENLTSLATCLQNYFLLQQTASKFAKVSMFNEAVEENVKFAAKMWRKKIVEEQKVEGEEHEKSDDEHHHEGEEGEPASPSVEPSSPSSPNYAAKTFRMKPKVEGRIVCIQDVQQSKK